MHPNGYGFLRNPGANFTRERTDPFVPGTMIEKFQLREGVLITGMVQRHRRGQGHRAARHAEATFTAHIQKETAQDFYRDLKARVIALAALTVQPRRSKALDVLFPLRRSRRPL